MIAPDVVSPSPAAQTPERVTLFTITGAPAIRVVDVEGKGRGVVAARDIVRGERIERVPVVVLSQQDGDTVDGTRLGSYVFNWSDGGVVIALGAGSLYNHSYAPNAEYQKRFDEVVIDFVALTDIAEGTEITVNYNGHPADQTPMWFDVK